MQRPEHHPGEEQPAAKYVSAARHILYSKTMGIFMYGAGSSMMPLTFHQKNSQEAFVSLLAFTVFFYAMSLKFYAFHSAPHYDTKAQALQEMEESTK